MCLLLQTKLFHLNLGNLLGFGLIPREEVFELPDLLGALFVDPRLESALRHIIDLGLGFLLAKLLDLKLPLLQDLVAPVL